MGGGERWESPTCCGTPSGEAVMKVTSQSKKAKGSAACAAAARKATARSGARAAIALAVLAMAWEGEEGLQAGWLALPFGAVASGGDEGRRRRARA